MRHASAARLVRLGPAAILALTALALSRPAEVQAGCGLYVSHAASGEAFLHELSPSILGDVGAAERSERPRPCSGPSCSEAAANAAARADGVGPAARRVVGVPGR